MRAKPSLATGVWLTVMAAEVWLMMIPIGVAKTRHRVATFDTGELAEGITISQTFVVAASGLNRISLFPSASHTPAGNVRVSLHELAPSGERRLHEQIVNAETIAAGNSWTWVFPPVDDSSGRTYRIDLAALTAQSGVRLRAAAASAYERGTMLVDHRPLPADLMFRTGAIHASAARRLARRFQHDALLGTLAALAVFVQAGALLQVLRALTTAYGRRP